jgi:SPP1 family phage portal protein
MIKRDLKPGEILTEEEIVKIINDNPPTKYTENERYFVGNNPPIIDRKNKTNTKAPDNRIPVAYGRKIVLTTKNYMFNKEVQYNAENKDYMNQLNDIFFLNKNERKIGEVGLDLILHGVAYKLFYTDTDKATPKYTIIESNEMLPVYDYSVEPVLMAAIRYYLKGQEPDEKYKIEVYYSNNVVFYETESNTISVDTMHKKSESPHNYPRVPVVHYGDKYMLGVIDAIKKLIDGIDTIISMDLDEIEKFALAYLVLKGEQIQKDDLDTIKEKRLFEIEKEADLQYLLKEINDDFNGSILDFLVHHVHKISGVPDFASKDFAAESGIALLYKLLGFENIASDIQKIFEAGEQNSIDLINSFGSKTWDSFKFWKDNPDKQVEITMSRNLPEDVKSKMEIADKMKLVGVSLETIFEFLPMIKDVEKELERVNEQKDAEMERFEKSEERQTGEIEEPVEDDDEQEEENNE